MTEIHPLEVLSFYNPSDNDLWNIEPSEDYADDCATGRSAAEELLAYVQGAKFPGIFGHVAAAIALKGKRSGVEVGFWHGIASAAMSAPRS